MYKCLIQFSFIGLAQADNDPPPAGLQNERSVGNSTTMAVLNISGTVTSSSDGTSIPGVSIPIKETTVGTATDINGKYDLVVQNNDDVLIFSSIGYISQELTINSR